MRKYMWFAAKIGAGMIIAAATVMLVAAIALERSEGGEYRSLAGEYVNVADVAEPAFVAEGREITEEGEEGGQGKTNRLNIIFSILEDMNSEIAGWIYIEGTPISYPVVQAADNSKYLKMSFSGTENKLGTIFLDKDLDMDESDVLIMYGHNMGFGRSEMFSTLAKYDDINYLREHPAVITQSKKENETEWRIFAVTEIATWDKEKMSLYRLGGFYSKESRGGYIGKIKEAQLYDTGIVPPGDGRLLILSTCTGDGRGDMRKLIFAYEAKP